MKVDEIPGKMRRKSKESLMWNSKFERQSPNQILVLERERERGWLGLDRSQNGFW